jgi:hypothetical protein
VTGRKRHILVDTLEVLLVVVVHAASIQESEEAKLVLRRALGRFPRLAKIWADQGDKAHLVAWAQAVTGWAVELVARPAGVKGFQVLPRRWVVGAPWARTFAWLGRSRRRHMYRDIHRRMPGCLPVALWQMARGRRSSGGSVFLPMRCNLLSGTLATRPLSGG